MLLNKMMCLTKKKKKREREKKKKGVLAADIPVMRSKHWPKLIATDYGPQLFTPATHPTGVNTGSGVVNAKYKTDMALITTD